MQRRAVRLRLAGCSFRAIGAALGVSHTWAAHLVRAAVESPPGNSRTASRLRDRELSHVDGRLAALARRREALAAAAGALPASLGGAA